MAHKHVARKGYRVDSGDEYLIDFYHDGSKYSMYAPLHPECPFDPKVTESHLYDSGQICVTAGKEPRTLDEAKAIAMVWAEGYSEYIRTGSFPAGGKRVRV